MRFPVKIFNIKSILIGGSRPLLPTINKTISMDEAKLLDMLKGPTEEMFILACRIIGEHGLEYTLDFFKRYGEESSPKWIYNIKRSQTTIETTDIIVRFSRFAIHLSPYRIWLGIDIGFGAIFRTDIRF